MAGSFDPTALMGSIAQAVGQLQGKAKDVRSEGEAGDGAVKVTVSGQNEVLSVQIADEALADREALEELVRVAVNDALRRVRETMAEELGGMAGGMPTHLVPKP